MDLKNTENIISKFCSDLIQKARENLNKDKKRAKGTLFDEMSFDIEKTDDKIKGVIRFGSAEDYWIFVDQGVQGAGGFKGSGKKRGQGSPFKFSNRQPPLSAIIPWIKLKGIKGRDKKGRFITDKSLGFLIARSIKQKGIKRTRFITKPYEDMKTDLANNIQQAITEDINAVETETKLEINLSK